MNKAYRTIYDTETTGTGDLAIPVQIAFRKGEGDVQDYLINPEIFGKEYSSADTDKTSNIHGITKKILDDAKDGNLKKGQKYIGTKEEYLGVLRDGFKGQQRVGYNSKKFDARVLLNSWARASGDAELLKVSKSKDMVKIHSALDKVLEVGKDRSEIDVMDNVNKLFFGDKNATSQFKEVAGVSDLENRQLGSYYDFLGLKSEGVAHDASYDIRMTEEVQEKVEQLEATAQKLKHNKDGVSAEDLELFGRFDLYKDQVKAYTGKAATVKRKLTGAAETVSEKLNESTENLNLDRFKFTKKHGAIAGAGAVVLAGVGIASVVTSRSRRQKEEEMKKRQQVDRLLGRTEQDYL